MPVISRLLVPPHPLQHCQALCTGDPAPQAVVRPARPMRHQVPAHSGECTRSTHPMGSGVGEACVDAWDRLYLAAGLEQGERHPMVCVDVYARHVGRASVCCGGRGSSTAGETRRQGRYALAPGGAQVGAAARVPVRCDDCTRPLITM